MTSRSAGTRRPPLDAEHHTLATDGLSNKPTPSHILEEFNLNPDLSRWRDLSVAGGGERCYSAAAYMYFHEKDMKKRERLLEMAVRERGCAGGVRGE